MDMQCRLLGFIAEVFRISLENKTVDFISFVQFYVFRTDIMEKISGIRQYLNSCHDCSDLDRTFFFSILVKNERKDCLLGQP